MFIVSEPAPPRHRSLLKTPVSIARDALDFRKLIRAGETVGWAEATAEPLLLTRLLDAQAEHCSPFRVFFPLTFSDSLAAGQGKIIVLRSGFWRPASDPAGEADSLPDQKRPASPSGN